MILNSLKILIIILLIGGNSIASNKKHTVENVMTRVINDLYKTSSPTDLMNLDLDNVMTLFSKEELKILATCHWMFDVNVPVIVSIMRSEEQKTLPFWMTENGFQKTDMTMKNDQTTYEIWQKSYNTGRIALGVNGFENGLALHYFVSVAPQYKGDQLNLTNFFPKNQQLGVLRDGASTYMDWDELVLHDVPDSMKGQVLLTTTRGRASESHLVGAFRSTPYPSTKKPDQIVLTWSSNPENSIDIQWRTNTTVDASTLKYREIGTTKVYSAIAEKIQMEDRMLMNDRISYHYTVKLTNLKPGTSYEYSISKCAEWSNLELFTTSHINTSFSFLWFGDTHYSSKFGEVLKQGWSTHPDASFFSIVGDLVSDGLNRDQWDALLNYSKETTSRIPFMSVPGNHDNRAGLGAKMYCDLFSYPLNGPEGVPKEQTYSFTYKNTLFLMIDATSPINLQSPWIETQLASTKATWKIAMFHFAPYNREEPYPEIQKAWIPLFDKYHVDMVFGGHLHYYMRSKPMNGGLVVPSTNNGTIYTISVGIPSQDQQFPEEPYAQVVNGNGHLYQYVKINGNSLYFESKNSQGKMIDQFEIKK
jgi:hypothetical protein